MRTPEQTESALLAELIALQRDNPAEAKRRFDALTEDELRVLSLHVALRLMATALKGVRSREVTPKAKAA